MRNRIEGNASFEVRGDNMGQAKNCRITSSAGHPALDKETCKQAMKRARWVVDPNAKEYARRYLAMAARLFSSIWGYPWLLSGASISRRCPPCRR
ncbi:MAG: energy transducer TonB [Sphingopyxis sp.]|nr:energy transducer TonB [Sphingopyxis sp.]